MQHTKFYTLLVDSYAVEFIDDGIRASLLRNLEYVWWMTHYHNALYMDGKWYDAIVLTVPGM